MAVKKAGWGLIITGTAGIVLSVLVGVLLAGRENAQPIRILGIEIAAVLILLGLWLLRIETTEDIQSAKRFRALLDQMLDMPTITWVILGFLVVYLLFFIRPIFLNSALEMSYYTRYIPNMNPIGNDLRVKIDLLKGLLVENESPYHIGLYPPLTYALFAPLLLIKDSAILYRLFTIFSVFNYCLLALLSLKIIDKRHLSLALLLFVTGLFSYAFQFELERGQYNILTFQLCLTSIYIFHYHPKYRLLAYFLFSLSVQLKLYPAIFIVMFVDDWREWKKVILRFAGIGVFNFGLFFIMGYQVFLDFFHSVTTQMVNPSWIGSYNHSISSFIFTAKSDGLGLMARETLRTFRHNAGWFEAALLLAFLVLFAAGLTIFHLRKESGLDPYLLLSCTIGALILPISYDYTLIMLTVPLLLVLSGMPEMKNAWSKVVSILLTLGVSTAYALTLIPHNYRPHMLRNIFPALFLILILVTILNYMRYKTSTPQALTE